jgi:hypothetical protein
MILFLTHSEKVLFKMRLAPGKYEEILYKKTAAGQSPGVQALCPVCGLLSRVPGSEPHQPCLPTLAIRRLTRSNPVCP